MSVEVLRVKIKDIIHDRVLCFEEGYISFSVNKNKMTDEIMNEIERLGFEVKK